MTDFSRYRTATGRLGLLQRTEDFAVQAVELFRQTQKRSDRAGWVLGRQFLRAATSVGANAEEAQGAESRRAFRHRYQIARKELRECRFWLRVMWRTEMVTRRAAEPLLAEAGELYAIMTAIIRRTDDLPTRRRSS